MSRCRPRRQAPRRLQLGSTSDIAGTSTDDLSWLQARSTSICSSLSSAPVHHLQNGAAGSDTTVWAPRSPIGYRRSQERSTYEWPQKETHSASLSSLWHQKGQVRWLQPVHHLHPLRRSLRIWPTQETGSAQGIDSRRKQGSQTQSTRRSFGHSQRCSGSSRSLACPAVHP